jgi:hypothetical protein
MLLLRSSSRVSGVSDPYRLLTTGAMHSSRSPNIRADPTRRSPHTSWCVMKTVPIIFLASVVTPKTSYGSGWELTTTRLSTPSSA